MIKKKLWLIVVAVVAIAFSANAFAMMGGNNGSNSRTQRYGSGGSHMNDDNRGHYSDSFGNIHNGNNYGSHMDGYNRGYRRDGKGNYMGSEDNFRRNHERSVNPKEYRYNEGYRDREDQRYHRD